MDHLTLTPALISGFIVMICAAAQAAGLGDRFAPLARILIGSGVGLLVGLGTGDSAWAVDVVSGAYMGAAGSGIIHTAGTTADAAVQTHASAMASLKERKKHRAAAKAAARRVGARRNRVVAAPTPETGPVATQ